jgi:hypothetical protein
MKELDTEEALFVLKYNMAAKLFEQNVFSYSDNGAVCFDYCWRYAEAFYSSLSKKCEGRKLDFLIKLAEQKGELT